MMCEHVLNEERRYWMYTGSFEDRDRVAHEVGRCLPDPDEIGWLSAYLYHGDDRCDRETSVFLVIAALKAGGRCQQQASPGKLIHALALFGQHLATRSIVPVTACTPPSVPIGVVHRPVPYCSTQQGEGNSAAFSRDCHVRRSLAGVPTSVCPDEQ